MCVAQRLGAPGRDLLRAPGCANQGADLQRSDPMRILFAIPHYFAPAATGHYGSERGAPEARALATRLCVASLWQTFSEAQALLDGYQQDFCPANPRLAAAIDRKSVV